MTPTQNQAVLTWIDEMAARTRPASIVWIDGSEEQLEALRAQAVREGIPVSYTHLDVYKRQARRSSTTSTITRTCPWPKSRKTTASPARACGMSLSGRRPP